MSTVENSANTASEAVHQQSVTNGSSSLQYGIESGIDLDQIAPTKKEVNDFIQDAATVGSHLRRTIVLFIVFLVVVSGIVLAALYATRHNSPSNPQDTTAGPGQAYSVQSIPLTTLGNKLKSSATTQPSNTLTVNGSLNVNGSLVIEPATQPTNAVAGEIYYDSGVKQLSYFNGSNFINLQAATTIPTNSTVQTINAGVLSLGGQAGTISLGNGLAIGGGQLRDTGILRANSTGNALQLETNGGRTITTVNGTGTTLFKPSANATIAFQIQPASSTTPVFDVDTTNGRIGIGTNHPANTLDLQVGGTVGINLTNTNANVTGQIYNDGNLHVTGGSNNLWLDAGGTGTIFLNAANGNPVAINEAAIPLYPLEVNGDVNITTTHAYRIAGTAICTTAGCTAAPGSTDYIQNSTTQQTGANFNIDGSGTADTLNATTIFQNGNQVCDASGNCAGSGGSGGVTGSGTTGTIPLFTGSTVVGNSILTQASTTVTVGGTLVATMLQGNGAGVTNVNAATLQGNASSFFTNAINISSGSLADARLSANVPLLNASNNFTGANLQHNGNSVCDISNNCNYLTGSAANGSYIELQAGTPGAAQTGNYNISGTGLSGSLKATTVFQNGNQVCDTSGNCTVGGGGSGLTGSGTTNTLAMFTAAGAIGNSIITQSGTTDTVGGTLSATNLQGNGSGITSLNASNVSSGTLADARLSANVSLLNAATNNFTGTNLQHNGNAVCDASNNCNYLTGSAANGLYIQLQGSTPGSAQTGNFNINGTGIAGTLQAGTFDTASAGTLNIGTTNANAITIGQVGDTTTAAGSLTVSGALNANGLIIQNYSSAVDNSGMSLTATNTNTSATTHAVGSISIHPVGTANSNTNANVIEGVFFNNVTTLANNSFYALNFGTGYNDLLRYNGTQLISGTGILQNAALSNAVNYSNLAQVGALSSGSIAAGFGTISTGNNITTTATLQGNTVTAGTASVAGSLVLQDGGGHAVTFSSAAQANNVALSVPADTHLNDTFCLVTLANCSGSGSGVTTVGSFSGSSQTNGASIAGTTITFGPADASTPGMISTGSQTIAGAKTFTSALTASAGLTIGTGATGESSPVLLVLDNGTSASDPTGVTGAMYYSTTYDDFRCYTEGEWEPCSTQPIDHSWEVNEDWLGGNTVNAGVMNGGGSFASGMAGFGQNGWSAVRIGTGASTECYNVFYDNTNDANAPGVLGMTDPSDGAKGEGCRMVLGASISGDSKTVTLGAGQDMKASVADGSLNTATVIGMDDDITGSAVSANDGLEWVACPNDGGQACGTGVSPNANWQYCYSGGGSATCAASSVPIAAGGLVRVEIQVVSTSAVNFYINGNKSALTGISFGTGVDPDFACWTLDTSNSASCFSDYYQIRGDTSVLR